MCEDWDWWAEVGDAPFELGVCIYSEPEPAEDGLLDYFCTDSVISPNKWSWRRFRFLDTTSWAQRLYGDVVAIFEEDPEVEVISSTLPWPYLEDSKLLDEPPAD